MCAGSAVQVQKDASKMPAGAQSKEGGVGSSGASPEVEDSPVEKKLKNLRKRLRQIDELKEKEASGELGGDVDRPFL